MRVSVAVGVCVATSVGVIDKDTASDGLQLTVLMVVSAYFLALSHTIRSSFTVGDIGVIPVWVSHGYRVCLTPEDGHKLARRNDDAHQVLLEVRHCNGHGRTVPHGLGFSSGDRHTHPLPHAVYPTHGDGH